MTAITGQPPSSSAGIPPVEQQFDRTPPQDIAAEQSVLGGMLLSKDAIADVVEVLRDSDFYRPNHATIFEAILDLYGRGEPADAVTVAAAMANTGELARVGGAGYLHTLMSSVPTAANAAYYARIVAERAVLRRLIEAGTRIVQLGYGSAAGTGRDADDLVDVAQQAVYEITERRVSDGFAILSDLLQPTLDEIEAVGTSGGVMTGVPTGFTDLDRLLNGLHPGQLIVVAGRPGLGKALALDTPLPTPDGWTTMGEVKAGDRLIGADGRPALVTATSNVMVGHSCYEVEFSDGSVIVADAEHLWKTSLRASLAAAAHGGRSADTLAVAPEVVVTTAQIATTLRHPTQGGPNHAVEACQPLDLPYRELPAPPYMLGAALAAYGAGGSLTTLGALADWCIPDAYLRAAQEQRRALLTGLLDTGGAVTPAGTVQYRSTSRRLIDGVRELVVSLGYVGTVVEQRGGVRIPEMSTEYVLTFTTGGDMRVVVDVRPAPSVPVRCVTVDNEDHLYLAGRSMIPTHNSTAALDFARTASLQNNLASAIFSLEMSKVEIVMRLLSAEARVPLHVLRSGQLSDDDWIKLARRMGEISEAPLFVDDTPNMNLMEIRAKARRLKQRHDLKLVVVDYLQLMSSPKRTESRQQEVAELSRGLKLLAKEIDCPVVAVSQLNRGPEQRNDKRPQLSDLRESGCLTAATRVLRADTNIEVSLGELLATGERDIPVWALDERLKYTPSVMTHVFPTGRRPAYRLWLASGKQIEATANHAFLTYAGWRRLDTLSVGDRLAVPRHVPSPQHPAPQPDAEIIQLAARSLRSGHVPERVFSLPKRQVALFLKQMWAASGSVNAADDIGGSEVCCTATSPRLVDDVSNLLLRFGISSRIRVPEAALAASHWSARPQYVLDIPERDDQLRFLRGIGGCGQQAAEVSRLTALLERHRDDTNAHAGDRRVWRQVRDVLVTSQSTGNEALARLASVLHAEELDLTATNDVFWDEIAAVEPIGEQDVYDATVLDTHNFIANGISTHNSIEQDADVVILLHRDDYYDKESSRAGEADFIVAKHRNGPTDTVTVAAQLHLARFVDMAVG